jgi:phospholipid/cholesterol/gamma-HCH transport system substrate-binding protein
MELQFKTEEKIVGVFVVCTIFLLISAIVLVGRGKGWFKSYVTYYTVFKETYNLQENAAVRLYKAQIGKVKKITLINDQVRVRLAIQSEYASRIRQDTRTVVESPTFIGSEYVAILPGDREAPVIPEEGDIPALPKKSISDILNEFQIEKTAKKFVQAVQDLSDVANTLKDPKGPVFTALDEINQILSNMRKISDDIEAGKGSVGRILRSERMSQNIQNSLDRVESILTNADAASAKIPGTMDKIDQGIDQAKQIEESIYAGAETVKHILETIEKDTQRLKVILSNMEKGSHDVPRITETAKQGIQEIRRGVENIDAVTKALQRNLLIRGGLPPAPAGEGMDAGLRD